MSVGPWQAITILLVVLILFGAGKLPAVMHDLGCGLRSFKKALQGKDQCDKETEDANQNSNNAQRN